MMMGAEDYDPNDEAIVKCSVCKGEYDGTCPVSLSNCPFLKDNDSPKGIEKAPAADELEDFDEDANEDDADPFDEDFDND
jgi:hypothetical protein